MQFVKRFVILVVTFIFFVMPTIGEARMIYLGNTEPFSGSNFVENYTNGGIGRTLEFHYDFPIDSNAPLFLWSNVDIITDTLIFLGGGNLYALRASDISPENGHTLEFSKFFVTVIAAALISESNSTMELIEEAAKQYVEGVTKVLPTFSCIGEILHYTNMIMNKDIEIWGIEALELDREELFKLLSETGDFGPEFSKKILRINKWVEFVELVPEVYGVYLHIELAKQLIRDHTYLWYAVSNRPEIEVEVLDSPEAEMEVIEQDSTTGGTTDQSQLQHQDQDNDGYTPAEGDCDDGDASVHPYAEDICEDGIDQDCSGSDERCNPDVHITHHHIRPYNEGSWHERVDAELAPGQTFFFHTEARVENRSGYDLEDVDIDYCVTVTKDFDISHDDRKRLDDDQVDIDAGEKENKTLRRSWVTISQDMTTFTVETEDRHSFIFPITEEDRLKGEITLYFYIDVETEDGSDRDVSSESKSDEYGKLTIKLLPAPVIDPSIEEKKFFSDIIEHFMLD